MRERIEREMRLAEEGYGPQGIRGTDGLTDKLYAQIRALRHRVEELQAENLGLHRKIIAIDDAVEGMGYEMEDGSQPTTAHARLQDILAGLASNQLD